MSVLNFSSCLHSSEILYLYEGESKTCEKKGKKEEKKKGKREKKEKKEKEKGKKEKKKIREKGKQDSYIPIWLIRMTS